ncbi:hypothetical protein NLJ89_g5689 [Agrocybe chaxingu]|uniref:Histone deacetylase interacting domain-containing protein n=1 Tax=Agrocybe chaxingu TaxID=84603 RepID=A0A9W8K0S2_9AGAR|nr:hypothetical protein NLJ89_g5689 [Agrocybe chaxingu]
MDTDRMAVDSPGRESKRLPENSPRTLPPLSDQHSQNNDRKATPKPEILEQPLKEDRVLTPRIATPIFIPRSEPGGPLRDDTQRSRKASPMDTRTYSTSDRPLNVTDALSYLDAVKVQFQDKPDVYNHFLDIMKEFKNEQIDTPGVIQRVSHLFTGHSALIQGFNTFLPVGYRIEINGDPQNHSITVTTPSGTSVQSTLPPVKPLPFSHGTGYGASIDHSAPRPASPEPRSYGGMDGQAIEPAVQYVQKIKQRCDPETYRQFLDILSRYHHTPEAIDEDEVSRQIARLFKDAPDLRADFRVFMPDRSQQLLDEKVPSAREKDRNRRKLDVVASSVNNSSSLPQKRKRKATDKEREREKEPTPLKTLPPAKKPKHSSVQDTAPISYNPKHVVAAPSSPRRASHHTLPPQPPRMPVANDDAHFFDRVKRVLQSREIYNEFLKLVNLFAQDYIDTARLVKESRHFLGNTELYKQFRDIVGWDDKKEREHFLAEQHNQSGWTKPALAGLPARPGRIDLSEKFGSYRKVSASEANVPCSGRDEMCRSVLNDEWVSHPTWTSEDSGFVSHKKNIYEEALHRSEEERHEYDFHIEAIVRTIAMLEPINNKIAQMSPEDRGNFKLKANLGGSWKAIHQRVIKKIYGREAGLEVIQAMQETPAHAIPVVLQRLKQREEEWKRAQREWNKVWREVDARNYAKSLDHQAISFKVNDKKALATKALVNQIETAREEQTAKRASLIDPLFARTRPRYQLEFLIDSESVLQDAIKLTFSFLDRTQGQINAIDRRRIESFLRTFIPLFFTLDPIQFNSSFIVLDTVESDNSDVDVASVAEDADGPATSNVRGTGRNGRKHAPHHSSGGDLRKKLLKSEQAKSTNRKTRAYQEAPSPAASRFASPIPLEEDKADSSSAATKRSTKGIHAFFTNTTFYALLRLIEVLYSRLSLFKSIAATLSKERHAKNSSQNGVDTGTTSPGTNHFYEMLLGQCERLFENEIEQHKFEDDTRTVFGLKHAYKIFTVDKVIGAIIKQAQAIIADPKSQELLEYLKRERALPSPTTQDRINSRRHAEKVLGPDENVFRIDWLPESKTMTFQLIGKDDTNYEDPEVLTGRWQAYIDAYVSSDATEGVSHSRARRPYLRRNLPAAVRETPPDVASQDGLEIKVCVRTYRLFYVSKTEDFLWKYRSKEDVDKNAPQLKLRNRLRRNWVESAKSSIPNP